jgi:predicted SAM-dependent methyltransferase
MVEDAPVKLDLGCGKHLKEGFIGVDKFKDTQADIVHDLLQFPWPFQDESVDEIHCSHFLEHVPGKLRGAFLDEVFRVLKTGSKVAFIVPAYNHQRAVQDFTHEWPPICPNSFWYFNRAWREANGLTHGDYDLACDFDLQISGAMEPAWSTRSLEAQAFASAHYMNITADLWAVLTKR